MTTKAITIDPAALRRARRAVDLTQRQAADEIGVTERTIRSWERGRHPVPADAVGALARLYQVDNLWSLFREAEEV